MPGIGVGVAALLALGIVAPLVLYLQVKTGVRSPGGLDRKMGDRAGEGRDRRDDETPETDERENS
ncbi:hypothetical protein ACFQDG_06360 [Natronoarchaeum mannanilyticum]|uniref:Uncharacterized protein n=1 Tax=Natronoarchaeum mannanilyticum TaxID=926360 RepID=A0AAV3T7J9_9EURY